MCVVTDDNVNCDACDGDDCVTGDGDSDDKCVTGDGDDKCGTCDSVDKCVTGDSDDKCVTGDSDDKCVTDDSDDKCVTGDVNKCVTCDTCVCDGGDRLYMVTLVVLDSLPNILLTIQSYSPASLVLTLYKYKLVSLFISYSFIIPVTTNNRPFLLQAITGVGYPVAVQLSVMVDPAVPS